MNTNNDIITLPLTYENTALWPLLSALFFIVDPILFTGIAFYMKSELQFEQYWALLIPAALTPVAGLVFLRFSSFGTVTVDRHLVQTKPVKALGFSSCLPEREFSMAEFSHITLRAVQSKHSTTYFIDLVHATDAACSVPIAAKNTQQDATEHAHVLATLLHKPFKDNL